MNTKQIVDDIDFVKKYKDYDVLINEPEYVVRKLFTIYNVFDILKYMFSESKSEYNIEDLESLYTMVYNDISREVQRRYEERRLLLINQKAGTNYEDNVNYLIELNKKHYMNMQILSSENESEEESEEEVYIPKKEEPIIDNKCLYIKYGICFLFFNIFVLSILLYKNEYHYKRTICKIYNE